MASGKRQRRRARKAIGSSFIDPLFAATGAKKPKAEKQRGDPWRLYGMTTTIPGYEDYDRQA